MSLSLSKDLLNTLYTTVSKALLPPCLSPCLSSIYPKLSFYYYLQSYSLSLSISVADYCSKLLFQCTNVKFTVNASFYYITSTHAHQHLMIFWVFVAREFNCDRQTTALLYRYNYIYIYIIRKLIIFPPTIYIIIYIQ